MSFAKIRKWSVLTLMAASLILSPSLANAEENEKIPKFAIEIYSTQDNEKEMYIHWGIEKEREVTYTYTIDGKTTTETRTELTIYNPQMEDYPENAVLRSEVEVSKTEDFSEVEKFEMEKYNYSMRIGIESFEEDGGKLFTRVRPVITLETGEIVYGDWSATQKLVFLKINKKNFPGLYKILKTNDDTDRVFDMNKDGWLDSSELDSVDSINIKNTSISNLKGIEHFKNLQSFHLYKYAGTKIDVSQNEMLHTLYVKDLQTKEITVKAPHTNWVSLEAMEKLSKIDVSACGSAKEIDIGCWEQSVKTIKLPKVKKNLKSLHIRGYTGKTLNFNSYTKLMEVSILGCTTSQVKLDKCENLKYLYFYWSNNIKSIDLTKNTKLKYVDFYGCKSISLKAVKTPKKTKVTTGKGCYWWSTEAYKKDAKGWQ